MDDDRFDSLTRSLTTPISRRVTLRGLAAGVLVALGLALDETTVLAKNKGNGNKGKGNGKGDNKKDRKREKRREEGEQRACNGSCQPGDFCDVDGDCIFGVCDGGLCRFCREDRDCLFLPLGLGGRRCLVNEVGDKQCFACASSADCGSNQTCDTVTHSCVECTSDISCQTEPRRRCVAPSSGECASNSGRPCVCRQCATSNDCAPEQFCNASGACDADCDPACGPDEACIEGVCVGRECAVDEDCPLGQLCDAAGACVPCASTQTQGGQMQAAQCIDTCANGGQDGGETDIDCGGVDCPPCALGKQCHGEFDCRSNFCDQSASGGSGIGVCAIECASNRDCSSGDACVSGNCTGTCLPVGAGCDNSAGPCTDCCSASGCIGDRGFLVCCDFD